MQRRLPKGPIYAFERRRSRPELPLCWTVPVLHSHSPRDAHNGATAAARPSTIRHHGPNRRRGPEARTLCALSLREWEEVPILPWRPCAEEGTAHSYAHRTSTSSVARHYPRRNEVMFGRTFRRIPFLPFTESQHQFKIKGRNNKWLQRNPIS